MIYNWTYEGFETEIITNRADISQRLGCTHQENWPKTTHATPIGVRVRADSVLATLQVMQALGDRDTSLLMGNEYYSYIGTYRNPLVTEGVHG